MFHLTRDTLWDVFYQTSCFLFNIRPRSCVIKYVVCSCAATINTCNAQMSDSSLSVLVLTENVWMSIVGCRVERVEMRAEENGHYFIILIVDVKSLS
jgi:hypothetical protein